MHIILVVTNNNFFDLLEGGFNGQSPQKYGTRPRANFQFLDLQLDSLNQLRYRFYVITYIVYTSSVVFSEISFSTQVLKTKSDLC